MTESGIPEVGTKAPAFDLPAYPEGKFKLSQFKGKQNVVLYFYPKDATPGCTTESCEFRDHSAAFAAKDAVIIGISPDTEKAQTKFKNKFTLPFTLLADAENKGAEAYGVWVEKSMYGTTYMGVARTTFVIGPDGTVVRVLRRVKPEEHAAQVLEALAELEACTEADVEAGVEDDESQAIYAGPAAATPTADSRPLPGQAEEGASVRPCNAIRKRSPTT